MDVLIDPQTRQWIASMVYGMFVPHEAEMIKKIPLSRVPLEDVLCWPFSQDGRYTCKSGYRFLKDKENSDSSLTTANQDKELWRGVWSLNSLNKVKNQLCQACKNSLPTKANLFRWTVVGNPMCERCNTAPETALHALWSCPILDEVWSDTSLWSYRRENAFADFKELVRWVLQNNVDAEMFE